MSGFIDTVYLECFGDDDHSPGQYVTESVYTAWDGFRLLGVRTVPFKRGTALPVVQKDHAVVGFVGTVRRYLAQLGVPDPHVDSAPEPLLPFFRRRIWTTTMGEIRNRLDTFDFQSESIFIKPRRNHKLFTGHVLGPKFADLIQTASVADDVELLASEVVDYVSEYRGFILDRKLVGFRHYNGDFRRIPDTQVIDDALAAWGEDIPAACSIDLGLRRDGSTDIVEVNDAFALGGYGLRSLLYARMIEARWCEMVDL